MTMKKIKFLFYVLVMVLVYSCGSSKSAVGVQGDKLINVPCSGEDFNTNKEYFRANMTSLSTDMSMAKSKALTLARGELATAVNAEMKRVLDSYRSSYQVGESEEMKGKTEDMIRTVVSQQLSDTKIICEKMMKTEDGKYRSYVAIEMAKGSILKGINDQLKNDDKIRTDFEYEKFKKVFEEEMSKIDK